MLNIDTPKKMLCLIPSLGTGGAERQMFELIKLLNLKGIKPSLLTYYSAENDYSNNINVDRILINDTFFLKKYIKVIIYSLKIKPDVILSYGEIPNVLAIVISFLARKKIKVVVSERNTTQNYSFLIMLLFNLYRFSDVIVPNSISQTKFIKQSAPFLASKIKTITNYTDIDKFVFQQKTRDKIFRIGIFARYHSQKNILLFLDAIAEINKEFTNVEFYWYGEKFLDSNGMPTKHSKYYSLCVEAKHLLNLNNVFFNSFAKNIENEFVKFDAICLPSLYEGFSNTLSEAICCGKPILTSSVCDNILFVKEGENGFLFDPRDKMDMKNAISKMLLLDNFKLLEFQFNSRKLSETLFSQEKFVCDYMSVL